MYTEFITDNTHNALLIYKSTHTPQDTARHGYITSLNEIQVDKNEH